VQAFLETVIGEVPSLDVALDRARALHPLAGELVAPLLAATLSPTMIEASRKRNVIPGSCVIEVDCRLLPGQPPAEIEALLHAGVPGDWELEWILEEQVGVTRSPIDTPLWRALQAWVDGVEPGARLAPIVLAGFTDSHYLRSEFDTTAYGFFPLRAMAPQDAARLVHSADERIAVDDLEAGVDLFRHVATTLGP
jgi:acetylornithine deacetylase/succinyl-diaminopimelate desuccinylase-like protein